jgi:hypothetical protein
MNHPTTLPTEPLRSHSQARGDLAATLELSSEAPRATDEARKQLFERLKEDARRDGDHDGGDGGVRLRPLTTQEAEEPGVLWFFIPVDGGVAARCALGPRSSCRMRSPAITPTSRCRAMRAS